MDLSGFKVLELVLSEVLGKVALLGESFVTLVALVGLFSHVHADVIFEIPLFVKRSPAALDLAEDLLDLPACLGVEDVFDLVRVVFQQDLVSLSVLVHIERVVFAINLFSSITLGPRVVSE